MQEEKSWKQMGIWFGTAILIAIIAIGAFKLASKGQVNGDPAVNDNLPSVSESDLVRGGATSTVTLIEYSDFQCPACGAYYPLVEEVLSGYKDQLKFVYRHFPLPQHLQAEEAAFASMAANAQGKFWEMYSKLFENQEVWSGKANAEEIFISYAAELKLDTTKFKSDMKSNALNDKVFSDKRGGISAGVNSTPTFFLNGIKLQSPRSVEEFKRVIDNAIASST